MKQVRLIFWLHAIAAIYCAVCGLMDLTEHDISWLVPNIAAFYLLFLSLFVFPMVAFIMIVSTTEMKTWRRVCLLLTHVYMSFVQFFFGLAPLIS